MSRRDALALLGQVKDPTPWADLSAPTVTLPRTPEVPIVLPEGVTLDPLAAVPVRDGHKAPGVGIALGTALPVGTLVWARHNGWWREAVVVGERGKTAHPGATTGGKLATVPVIYTADRTGRLDRHRWPVAELRRRGETA